MSVTAKELAAYKAGKAAAARRPPPPPPSYKKYAKSPKAATAYKHPVKKVTKAPVSKSVGRALGAAAGTAIGGPAGTAIGGFLGGKIGHLFGQITGFGDYQVSHNSLFTGGMSPPMIHNTINSGGTIVRHREYIADIVSTSAFTVQQNLPLNPGLAAPFPWLFQVADAYEEFRWRGMIFEFKSMASDNVLSSSPNTALGSVVMATEYNVLNPPFPDKLHMENYEFANSSKPSCSFIHPIECKASVTPVSKLFVRAGPPPSTNADLRLYDLGNFQLATVGIPGTGGVIGELWVTYEVEFFKPKLLPPAGTTGGVDVPFFHDHFFTQSTNSATNPFGAGVTGPDALSTIGGKITTGNTYNFPPNAPLGLYQFTYSNYGSGVVTMSQLSITVAGGTIHQFLNAGVQGFAASPDAGVEDVDDNIATFYVNVLTTVCTVMVAYAGALPSGNGMDLMVVRMLNPIN